MRVLLTGAFGNLGSLVLARLVDEGHDVTAFDVATDVNREFAQPFASHPKVTIRWGDLRAADTLPAIVAGQDAVVHVAAVIPPFSEAKPELARAVNVGGTQGLLDAIAKAGTRPIFVFTSSLSVFGPRQADPPPRTLDDPLIPTDHYSTHKIEAEAMVRSSGLPWVILRLGAMVDGRMRHNDTEQLRLSLRLAADNRMEFIHPADATTAIVHALVRPEALGKVHLIGGGHDCQVRHLDMMNVLSGAMGVRWEASELGTEELYTDWVDTTQSQAILDFQHHRFADFRRECEERFGSVAPFVRPFAPLLKWTLRRLYGP